MNRQQDSKGEYQTKREAESNLSKYHSLSSLLLRFSQAIHIQFFLPLLLGPIQAPQVSFESSRLSKNDPVIGLKNYFSAQAYIPPKQKIKPAKRIVYNEKRSERMGLLNSTTPQDQNSSDTARLGTG